MDTFNRNLFTRLKQAERTHFWFSVRRMYIYDRIKYFSPPPARVLEIGCGTGYVSSFLSAKGYEVTGCEYFSEAVELAYNNFNITRGDARFLPFKEKSFNVVGLFDVIEHFEDDVSLLLEAKKVLKSHGLLVITVPAKAELWSYFDVKSHHKRRYSIEKLRSLFSSTGFRPLSIEHMFSLLYIPMKLRKKRTKEGESFKINPLVNKFLRAVFAAERIIAKTATIPFGTSLIAVCT